MTVIVCVDEQGGMAFNGRRQSRDRQLCADVIHTCGHVWMDESSAGLFADWQDSIAVSDRFLEEGDCCFAENRALSGLEIDTLILYRWNRRYPADRWLDIRPDEQGRVLISSEDFPGSSHERITREIWRNNHGKTEEP